MLKNSNTGITCINCGKIGHIFKNCLKPIISYGIIGFRINNNIPEYLIIQRKDTIGYTDFIRGKYSNNFDIVKLYLEEMTYEEICKIRKYTFRMLWDDIFCNKKSNIYRNEYQKAKKKFDSLDILSLTEDCYQFNKMKYISQEYGFPKGRKNLNEEKIDCAVREFEEETGYNIREYNLLKHIIPYKESYFGINGKNYIHVYYLAKFKNNNQTPYIDSSNYLQCGEIKTLNWMNYKNAYKSFRDYHSIKKNILFNVNKFVNNNYIR